MEKAHPDVWNIFLQIFDEGKLTDGKGRTVNMKNTIIIMTSNIGSQYISEITDKEAREKKIRDELKKYFRIEFLNRIDDIVIYESLTDIEIKRITVLLLQDVTKRLKEHEIIVSWNQDIIDRIAILGYDTTLGARSLKRAITEYIVNPLSEKILK